MKVKRWYTIILFAAGCIAVNCAGKFMALGLQLPLWLDSFGTVLAAYVLGHDRQYNLFDCQLVGQCYICPCECDGGNNCGDLCPKGIS